MTKIGNRLGLSSKLNLSILVMAIPIFLLSMGLLFLKSRNDIFQEGEQSAFSALNTSMQQVRKYMMAVETATNSNLWLIEENFQPDSLLAISNRIVRLNIHVSGCSITAEPNMFPSVGRYFSAYTIREGDSIVTQREAEYDYYSKEWYSAPIEQGKACWIDPFDDYTEGTLSNSKIIASYCKPIYKDEQIVGVISSDLSLNSLDKVINTVTPPYPSAYFVLIGGDGSYLTHPDSTLLFSKSDYIDHIAGRQGTKHLLHNGRMCQVSYQPIEGTDWSLAIVCPDSDILYSHNRLTYIVIPLLIIGLLFIVGYSYKAVTVSIRPLELLLAKTKAVAGGDLSVDIPHTNSTDVIGGLQNSFSAMLKSLNFYVDSVHKATDQNLQYNKELEQTTQLVLESEKQKTAFIQNVTHQIRTPLNIVMGFAQLLDNPIEGALEGEGMSIDELKNIAGTMNYNTRQLVRMVLMLFDCSDTGRAESGALEMADVDIADAMKEALDYTYNLFPDVKIDYHFNLPEGFTVRTHRRSVVYSVQEVLHNSVKYSDRQNISLTVDKTSDKVRFVIQDTGSGIDEADLDNIYKFFAKIDGFNEGLGLGLPLTKRHAEDIGGSFMLDTTYKEGCRFIFEIPLA